MIDFISSPFLSIVTPPIIALYYGSLDIWGDEWAIFRDYKETHEAIFTYLAIITTVILFLKGVAEQFRSKISSKYQNILQAMVAYFNELVKKKRDRFFQKARSLKPNTDIFKAITHPKEQLEYALDGTKRLLSNVFNLESKNIAITIIRGSEKEDTWWYEFKCDEQKQHTKAKVIMNGNSTAKYCFQTGESIFIPDIRKGVKEGAFLPSERSKKLGVGSIYCKPVRVEVNNIDYIYIFTIVVYGQFMCTPYDEEECRACERLLDEISDRVELELYLHSMKTFKESGGK
ncbi:hypothetical protein [Flavobacterium sp.]|uniref:hypothetical protein n=1 Tax=Flavobacterium sp. TaxID=239 RepID=UPI0025BF84F9|nr:hypothetical protein [Flavobacterium sp.]MBA4155745.1 hypothetical protein [Flavobacterium sp.]